mmetsp:Transcript_13455/g.42502  ORF Transcript_13455/g.42502 Transcript_13455/m.42502 type:complete len:206 (-) Transcript_13455:32-649(-)
MPTAGSSATTALTPPPSPTSTRPTPTAASPPASSSASPRPARTKSPRSASSSPAADLPSPPARGPLSAAAASRQPRDLVLSSFLSCPSGIHAPPLLAIQSSKPSSSLSPPLTRCLPAGPAALLGPISLAASPSGAEPTCCADPGSLLRSFSLLSSLPPRAPLLDATRSRRLSSRLHSETLYTRLSRPRSGTRRSPRIARRAHRGA